MNEILEKMGSRLSTVDKYGLCMHSTTDMKVNFEKFTANDLNIKSVLEINA